MGGALVFVLAAVSEYFFHGRARDNTPALLIVIVLAWSAAYGIGTPSNRTRSFLWIVAGFAVIGLVAAVAWYGYFLPAGCHDDGIQEEALRLSSC